MHIWNPLLYTMLSGLLSLQPPTALPALSIPDGKESSDYTFSIDAFGPGVENLSVGNVYAVYQWGLRNDGNLQLVEMRDRFQNINNQYANHSAQGDLSIPSIGPGAYEAVTTNAVPGMDINILPAWNLYESSIAPKRQVIVAIIDTGIDITHFDLVNSIWVNSDEQLDGTDTDGNGYVDDICGWNFFSNNNKVLVGSEDNHGTHAAGTIAANRIRGGIAGITDNNYVRIMPLKALGTSYGVGDAEAVISSIRYAETNGASICNLSFGTVTEYPELLEVMRNSNMLFIVSAGNGDDANIGYDIDQSPVYPASFDCDNIITVANLMFDGNLHRSSNFGINNVDIAAPGTYILSTTVGNSYGFMSGTSMSTPMVTGVAAMLYSYRSDISLSDVKRILLNSSRKLDTLTGKVASGGMLDAYAALTYRD